MIVILDEKIALSKCIMTPDILANLCGDSECDVRLHRRGVLLRVVNDNKQILGLIVQVILEGQGCDV